MKKLMTFQQAKRKLKKIAGGKYHTIEYKLTEYQDGRLEPRCYIYIDREDYFVGATWEEAFKAREVRINHIPVPLETIIVQQPEECEAT